ncbi:MAG: aminotransferase class V-fold PLP-dependent enzyme, partial [Myxococcales bacterium]|nr:aminotransferase class V-fold PLP-dependent enzyme [Myxococcales bacterium]
VASIVGLGVAAEHARADLERGATELRALGAALWRRLSAALPGLAINGPQTGRLPNTLNLRFPGVNGAALLAAAPEIAASTGAACHDGRAASEAILALGVPPDQARGSIRLSWGRGTSREEIERAADALIRAWRSLDP